jgi:hypothetical protein
MTICSAPKLCRPIISHHIGENRTKLVNDLALHEVKHFDNVFNDFGTYVHQQIVVNGIRLLYLIDTGACA